MIAPAAVRTLATARRAPGRRMVTRSPMRTTSAAAVPRSMAPTRSGTFAWGPRGAPLMRLTKYMATIAMLPALATPASHCRGHRRMSGANRAWPMPVARKKAPYAHHWRRCGATYARCTHAAPSESAAATAMVVRGGAAAARRAPVAGRGRAICMLLQRLQGGQRLGRVGGDRIGTARAHLELQHHVVVLVDEVVAVHHVAAEV